VINEILWNRILLESLIVAGQVKKFSTFCGTVKIPVQCAEEPIIGPCFETVYFILQISIFNSVAPN
jgi:hypothetical protein